MVYDNRHRIFLQSIMQGGVVLDQDATAMCFKIFNERISVSTISEQINNKLAPIAMAMKSGICELTGDKYWSIVGTTHEETLMIPSEFTTAQRAFLRAIYAEIIHSENGCISSTECLNLAPTLDQKLSMGDADKFLKSIVRRKWLHLRDGSIYMGVRSIIEMMPYFRETFLDNFQNCSLCREVVFTGQKCAYCDKIYHNYCLAKYESMQNENKCPECKRPWNSFNIPDEISQTSTQGTEDERMDVTEDNDDNEMSQSQINESRKAKKRRKCH